MNKTFMIINNFFMLADNHVEKCTVLGKKMYGIRGKNVRY